MWVNQFEVLTNLCLAPTSPNEASDFDSSTTGKSFKSSKKIWVLKDYCCGTDDKQCMQLSCQELIYNDNGDISWEQVLFSSSLRGTVLVFKGFRSVESKVTLTAIKYVAKLIYKHRII